MKNLLFIIVLLKIIIGFAQNPSYDTFKQSARIITAAGGIESGNSSNMLNLPMGIFVDNIGNIYIADTKNDRVQMWKPGSKKGITVAGGNGRGSNDNQLNKPSDVFVDRLGYIYVVDSYNHRVQKWVKDSRKGITVAGGNGPGNSSDQLNIPSGIFVDEQENIYVSDAANHRVQMWSRGAQKGKTIAGGNGRGYNENQLNIPTGIFVDKFKNVYICDTHNHRIQKRSLRFNSGVTTVAGGNNDGNATTQLSHPKGVFVDSKGNIYIADSQNHRIQKWSFDSKKVITVAGELGMGTNANQLSFPKGIILDEKGNIYISDSNNNRILKIYKKFDFENLTQGLIKDFTQLFVKERIDNWYKKDEFEKSSTYQLRVSENNRKLKIREYKEQAIKKLENEYSKTIDFGISRLGSYDADNSNFTIFIDNLEEIVLKVPIDEAPIFKKNWSKILKSKKYTLINNEFVLSSLNFLNPEISKSYIYNVLNDRIDNTVIDVIKRLDDSNFVNSKKVISKITDNPNFIKSKEVTSKRKIDSIQLPKLSDVDIDIPEADYEQVNSYALIIGNEDYKSRQPGLTVEQNVDFAINDAEIFAMYCKKTLGIPSKQVKILTNATSVEIKQGLAWINNLSNIEEGNANLIFYYSGHGLPDEQTKEPYLIPVDVSGVHLNYAIKLSEIYKSLTEYPAKQISVFLDACFSGGARNQGLLAMKGVKVKAMEELISGNIVVFSSSSGGESSTVFRKKQHGFFTYFLLKKLKETKGNIDFDSLGRFIKYSVRKESGLQGKIQTPQVNVGLEVEKSWKNWKLK